MDCGKVGKLIWELRTEKGMTQKALADALHISDRAVSKWERGAGCPDVSLLGELSGVLGVNIEKILSGELEPSLTDGGNMKRIQFYVCPSCGNVLTGTGQADISCCGRRLEPLKAASVGDTSAGDTSVDDTPAGDTSAGGEHALCVEEVEDEYFLTTRHTMEKGHHLLFVACVAYDRMLLVRLYPEQSVEVRMPRMRGDLYVCCSRDGLFRLGPPRPNKGREKSAT